MPEGHPDAAIVWQPGIGWQSCLSSDDPDHALLDLYLPICSATAARPITVGHLGQSLDGFIAMHTGESQFVTGPAEHPSFASHAGAVRRRHRRRGHGGGRQSSAHDPPRVGPQSASGRLRSPPRAHQRIPHLHRRSGADAVCVHADAGRPRTKRISAARPSSALDDGPAGVQVVELLLALRERGGARVFVEGGGVTVSAFLEANLLDRLHMAIAPLIIGDGRPAIRLPPRADPARLPSAALPRVSHGRRCAVRLRAPDRRRSGRRLRHHAGHARHLVLVSAVRRHGRTERSDTTT